MTQPTDSYYVPPIPPAPRKPRRARWIILGIVAAFVLIGGIAQAASGGKTPSAASSSSSQPAAAQATTSAPAPAQTTSDLASWWSGYGQTAAQTLGADFGQMANDATAGDFSSTLADCQQIQSDIQAAQADPPIPDPALEQQWSTALSDYSAAASDCVQGIQNQDASLIEQATAQESAGTTAITTLTTDLKNGAAS